MSTERKSRLTDDLNGSVPGWLWRGLRLSLLAVVSAGALTTLILAGGAADPPRAGPLRSSMGPLQGASVAPQQTLAVGSVIPLPPLPFTLEILGTLVTGDPLDAWGINLETADPKLSNITVWVFPAGYFSLAPLQPDSVGFFHIRPSGQENRLYWHHEASGEVTLRLNNEIAWQGRAPAARSARIQVRAGKATAQFSLLKADLYAPMP